MKNFNKKVKPIHQIGFSIDLEIMIPKDDSVRLLYEVTEGLNYSKLREAYSTIGRNPAISPKSLFRIILYGYMERVYSSRELEKSCKRDINFKWLLEGQCTPEHNTIAIDLKLKDYQIVLKIYSLNSLLNLENLMK